MPKGIYFHTKQSIEKRLLKKVEMIPECGCWIFMGYLTPCGYGQISVATSKCQFAHRVSYELFCGPIPNGMHVLHRCDVPACINPDHLFIGTHIDNVADMVAKGRNTRGETVGNSKLTAADVLAIRSSVAKGIELARTTGFSPGTISLVRNKKIWKHI